MCKWIQKSYIMINKHTFIHHLTSFYLKRYTLVITCSRRSTRYSCNGRNWWRNTQEISVIPLISVLMTVSAKHANKIHDKVKDIMVNLLHWSAQYAVVCLILEYIHVKCRTYRTTKPQRLSLSLSLSISLSLFYTLTLSLSLDWLIDWLISEVNMAFPNFLL